MADWPLAGAMLVLHLEVRRFFCRHTTCPRRMFAERFPSLVPVRGRHSLGVCAALRHVGLAVGGRAGVRLTRALGIPGSYRTIVRLVHGAPFPLLGVPGVIGLDAWAWRRGRRFGTILCDLERHHVLDLLPERSASSVAQWLRAHPSVEIVCRDRSGLYAEGIRQGAPQAIQVVDRFHLLQNLGGAAGGPRHLLPPYAPEWQPAECRAPFTTEALANRPFQDRDARQEVQAPRCLARPTMPAVSRAHTHFHWWPQTA